MRIRVTPMARSTPISFVWSNKLALIDALRLKNERNIIIAMFTMKIKSIMLPNHHRRLCYYLQVRFYFLKITFICVYIFMRIPYYKLGKYYNSSCIKFIGYVIAVLCNLNVGHVSTYRCREKNFWFHFLGPLLDDPITSICCINEVNYVAIKNEIQVWNRTQKVSCRIVF